MLKEVLILCFVNYISSGSSSSVPFIIRCKAADSECIKNSANAAIPILIKGIKEFGVEPTEPFILKEAVDSSAPGLKLFLSNLKVTGAKDCRAQSVYRDVANSKMYAKILCTVLTTGQYDMDGKLLVINVKGKGDIRVLLKKVLFTIEGDIGEKIGKDGAKHWDLKRLTHSFDLLDKSELEFKNLKTGSDVLDRAANEVITTSSNEIITEIGPPVIKAIILKLIENVRRFLLHVPIEDLTLDV